MYFEVSPALDLSFFLCCDQIEKTKKTKTKKKTNKTKQQQKTFVSQNAIYFRKIHGVPWNEHIVCNVSKKLSVDSQWVYLIYHLIWLIFPSQFLILVIYFQWQQAIEFIYYRCVDDSTHYIFISCSLWFMKFGVPV